MSKYPSEPAGGCWGGEGVETGVGGAGRAALTMTRQMERWQTLQLKI